MSEHKLPTDPQDRIAQYITWPRINLNAFPELDASIMVFVDKDRSASTVGASFRRPLSAEVYRYAIAGLEKALERTRADLATLEAANPEAGPS